MKRIITIPLKIILFILVGITAFIAGWATAGK